MERQTAAPGPGAPGRFQRFCAGHWLPQPLQGRPLLWLALGFCCGIVLASALHPTVGRAFSIGLILAAAGLLAAWCWRSSSRSWRPLVVSMLGLGLLLAAGQLTAAESWPLAPGEWAEISGRVQGLPLTYLDGGYRLTVRAESLDGQALRPCRIYVYGQGQPPPAASRVTVYGENRAIRSVGSAAAFDYRAYLTEQGISAQLQLTKGWLRVDKEGSPWQPLRWCQWLREGFCAALADLPPGPQALVRGVFLGDTAGLDPATDDQLAFSGMLHVFAVSGLHVGYIVLAAAALIRLLRRLLGRSRLRDAAVAVLLLGLYLGLVGAAASVLRALVMVLLVELARLLREPLDPVSSLSLAALICLGFRPLWLFTAGFQLSFVAMWSLTVLAPALECLLGLERKPEDLFRPVPWYSALVAAAAVSWGTAPFICRDFFYLSWWGWLVAPVVVVLAGAAVLLCLVALLGVGWLPPLARLAGTAAAGVMTLLEKLAAWLSGWPGQVTYSGLLPAWSWLGALLLLLLAPLLLRRGGRRVSAAALACSLLLLLVPAQWQTRTAFPLVDSQRALVSVTWLDVGQGDCCLVRTADGHSLLVDGGGFSQSPGAVGQQVVLPYLRSLPLDRLDYAVNTHPDGDHTDGLISVLQELPCGALLYSAQAEDCELQRQLLGAAAENGCLLQPVTAGCSFRVGEYLQVRVLNPQDLPVGDSENRASVVLLLSVGESDILLCGDAEADQLEVISREQDLQVEVWELPHHGSRSAYSEALYRQLDPQTVIVSVGAENNYGHPAPEVVKYWQGRADLYRTDLCGSITLYSDGQRELVCPYRSGN